MKRLILVLFFTAALGLSTFVWLAIRATDAEEASAERAAAAFDLAKGTLPEAQAIIRRNASGDFIQKSTPSLKVEAVASHLFVLAYRTEERRLSRARIPLWFLRMKEAPLRFILARFGTDLGDIEISVQDLSRAGPQLVLDEVESSGDRVLIWTE